MQRANPESGVRVPMRTFLMRCVTMRVSVKMHVAIAIMFVFVCVQICFERKAHGPKADS